MSGRHSPTSGPRGSARSSSGGPLGGRFPTMPVAIGAALAVLIGMGSWAVATHSGSGCSTPTALLVAASPDITPAVNAAVAANPLHCVNVAVSPRSGAEVAGLLSGRSAGTDTLPRPDVWIPDTSMWVAEARSSAAGAAAVPDGGPSIALSPVVIAMPTPLATTMIDGGFMPSWQALVANQQSSTPIQFEVGNPTTSGAGLSALAALAGVTGTSTPQQLVPLTAMLRGMTSGNAADTADILTSLPTAAATSPTSAGVGAFAAPEQAVWQYDSSAPRVPLTALYPSEGAIPMDYPYVDASHLTSAQKAAADALFAVLDGTQGRNVLQAHGFRAPDGSAAMPLMSTDGINAAVPTLAPVPLPAVTDELLGLWGTANSSFQMLAVVDLSGSMGKPLPTNPPTTRLSLTIGAMQQGLTLFPDSSTVGLWSFTTDPQTGATLRSTIVTLGPLGAPDGTGNRRQAAIAQLNGLVDEPGSRTGLYDTVVAAYKQVSASFDPTRLNSVVVFTDGLDPELNNISLQQAIDEIKSVEDPAKPIQVVIVAVGPGAQMGPLQQLTGAVGAGSVAFNPTTPSDVGSVFYQAIAARIAAQAGTGSPSAGPSGAAPSSADAASAG